MAEEQTQVTEQTEAGSSTGDAGEVSVEQMQAQIEELSAKIKERNHEAASKRVALEKAQAEIEALKQAKQKDLAAQGNYKALYDQLQQEKTTLEAKATRAESLEAMIREQNEARIANIPEDMRSLVPTGYSPEELAQWLTNNQSVFSRPQAPDLGAGVAGGNGATIKLTAVESEIAKRMGMTPEQYIEAKQKMGF